MSDERVNATVSAPVLVPYFSLYRNFFLFAVYAQRASAAVIATKTTAVAPAHIITRATT